ncbi:MAG: TLC domain-containing protein [Monoraphidium minutum]|nr:MAG: TLC domain-containing protein [Monoraphidium minutum]
MVAEAPQLLQRARALLPPLEGGREDLLLPLYQGLVLIVLRLAAEKTLVPLLRSYLKSRPASAGAKPPDRRAHEVVDNAFLTAVIAPLCAWGWWVMLYHNGPCTPVSTAGCLVGWPDLPVTSQFRWWWLSVGGLYAGEMIGTLIGGVGFKLSAEMMVHHAVTTVLMLYGYYGGLHRYGQMATTVLDSSNTLLHAAKAAHAMGLPALEGVSGAMFKLFALTFFIVRVVMPPGCMLWPGIKYGTALPTATYYTTNGLMFVIYALQIMWFYKIARIAIGGDKEHHAKPAAAAAAVAGAKTD